MPSSPVLPRSRRDSWPPTQLVLDHYRDGTTEPVPSNGSGADIDDDPLTYFLTPAPAAEDVDLGDLMDFDAGIEDSSHPREIVRSVSPSSLDGLNKTKTKGRKAVPGSGSPEPEPELSDCASPYDEDSDEDYIRFMPNKFGLPFSLRDFTLDSGTKMKATPRSFTAPPAVGSGGLLSPAAATPRSSPGPAHGRGRSRNSAARRRAQHVWREPSPDVWSIEEEMEEDSTGGNNSNLEEVTASDNKHVEVTAAKPKKKVRFLLPVKD